ncbi:hypothetical protein ACIQMP_07845 [Streptomyces sp. NPDC091385]|uniref:hypothetical protein n=1 Tax=Streptomyces sp. NPDC091385 TaxID=3365997 RepID=UPI003824F913
MSNTPDTWITTDHLLYRPLGHMPADKAVRLASPEWRATAATFAYAADRIEALPQDFELDPGRGDAVTHLRNWAEAARKLLPTPKTGAPVALAWARTVQLPGGDDPTRAAIVNCATPDGTPVLLVVEGNDRIKLATLLDEGGDINTQCPTNGCGTDNELDPADPAMFGWLHLDVAGLDGGPRWYCMPSCVRAAMARAGDELSALDGLDAQYGVGATDEYNRQLAEATADGFADAHADDSEDGTR